MSFRPIAFLDTTQFQGYLFTKYRDQWKKFRLRQDTAGTAHGQTETILLRGPHDPSLENWTLDVDHFDTPLLAEWKSAQGLLNRVRNACANAIGGQSVTLGKAMLVALKAGGHVDWHVDEGEYAERHDRLHLAIATNPAARLLSGLESINLPVGHMAWMNNRILHGALNLGDWPRIHLIVDVRKPDA